RQPLIVLVGLALFCAAGRAWSVEPDGRATKPARLLVVTVTNGFRHSSIETGEAVLERLGRESGQFHVDFLKLPTGRPGQPQQPKRKDGTSDADWKKQEEAYEADLGKFRAADAVWTKDLSERFAKVFSRESLDQFDGVVFLSTTGALPIPDLDDFLAWVRGGKTFCGFHAAADTFNASDAYRDLVGGIFAGHPWNAGDEHAFVVDDPGHPIVKSLPDAFRWKDEIYQYDTRFVPDDVRVLVSLDMAHSTPKEPWHVPVSWIRDYGRGRVFYSNFGHNETTWNTKMFQDHYLAGILWALGRTNAPVTPNPDLQARDALHAVLSAAAAAGAGGDAAKATAEAERLCAKADA
ncbi:MAG: ThuA domain-containing protein, partial [Planctomycetia bacterium]|nr:ThuA domain-containing protein [Planctomycetia bacterium]